MEKVNVQGSARSMAGSTFERTCSMFLETRKAQGAGEHDRGGTDFDFLGLYRKNEKAMYFWDSTRFLDRQSPE